MKEKSFHLKFNNIFFYLHHKTLFLVIYIYFYSLEKLHLSKNMMEHFHDIFVMNILEYLNLNDGYDDILFPL